MGSITGAPEEEHQPFAYASPDGGLRCASDGRRRTGTTPVFGEPRATRGGGPLSGPAQNCRGAPETGAPGPGGLYVETKNQRCGGCVPAPDGDGPQAPRTAPCVPAREALPGRLHRRARQDAPARPRTRLRGDGAGPKREQGPAMEAPQTPRAQTGRETAQSGRSRHGPTWAQGPVARRPAAP